MPSYSRADNGGKFISHAYTDLCDPCNIRRKYTSPDTPQQNGVNCSLAVMSPEQRCVVFFLV